MSKKISFICTLALFLGAPLVFANTVTICKHDNAVREIHVVYDVPGQDIPCSVNYVKDSGEQTLWRADNLSGYCEEKAAAFVAKQEGWGWTCDAQAAAATGSAEPDEAMEEMPEESAEEPIADEEEVDAQDPIE